MASLSKLEAARYAVFLGREEIAGKFVTDDKVLNVKNCDDADSGN